ncbi:hypothetical protein D020_2199B, partial [Vibrio parahaemolyticus SBR10290]
NLRQFAGCAVLLHLRIQLFFALLAKLKMHLHQ